MILSFINIRKVPRRCWKHWASFINIRKVPREVLKTEGEARGFQHLPRDLPNVNEWKIMFDPYITDKVRKSWERKKINYQICIDMCDHN